MAAPSWAPTLVQVAQYIPARTLTTDTHTYLHTFATNTNPTATEVDGLIADACTWVLVATGTLDSTLEAFAAAVAAVYAAACAERGFPDRDADVDTAQQLYDQAVAMRGDLDRANAALTGEDTTDPASAVPVLYGFPTPVEWGDENFI
jgi:hypothetical protein